MSKRKKEHQTFDRIFDKRPSINKFDYVAKANHGHRKMNMNGTHSVGKHS